MLEGGWLSCFFFERKLGGAKEMKNSKIANSKQNQECVKSRIVQESFKKLTRNFLLDIIIYFLYLNYVMQLRNKCVLEI
jgi:hypothetical protein